MFGGYKFSEIVAGATVGVLCGVVASTLVATGLGLVLPATAAAATGIGITAQIAGLVGVIAGFPMGIKAHDKVSEMRYSGHVRKRKHVARTPQAAAKEPGLFSKLSQKLSSTFGSKSKKADKPKVHVISAAPKNNKKPNAPQN